MGVYRHRLRQKAHRPPQGCVEAACRYDCRPGRADQADQQAGAVRAGAVCRLGQYRSPTRHPRPSGWTRTALSPIHHENFDWSTFTSPDQEVVPADRRLLLQERHRLGSEENQKVTQFTLTAEISCARRTPAAPKHPTRVGQAASRRGHRLPPTTRRRSPQRRQPSTSRCSAPTSLATSGLYRTRPSMTTTPATIGGTTSSAWAL